MEVRTLDDLRRRRVGLDIGELQEVRAQVQRGDSLPADQAARLVEAVDSLAERVFVRFNQAADAQRAAYTSGSLSDRLYTAREVGDAQASEAELVSAPLRRRIAELETALSAVQIPAELMKANERIMELESALGEAERDLKAVTTDARRMSADIQGYKAVGKVADRVAGELTQAKRKIAELEGRHSWGDRDRLRVLANLTQAKGALNDVHAEVQHTDMDGLMSDKSSEWPTHARLAECILAVRDRLNSPTGPTPS